MSDYIRLTDSGTTENKLAEIRAQFPDVDVCVNGKLVSFADAYKRLSKLEDDIERGSLVFLDKAQGVVCKTALSLSREIAAIKAENARLKKQLSYCTCEIDDEEFDKQLDEVLNNG